MGKPLFTAEQFIKAIPGTGGIVSTIAKRVGCDWRTARTYIDNHPTVKQVYDSECESLLDLAEGTLIKNIQGGDSQDAKWYLTKKGKHRGYGEAVDVTSGGDKLTFHVKLNGDEND